MGKVDIVCSFCGHGKELEQYCGKLHDHKKELFAHHKCMQYSSGLTQYTYHYFGGFDVEEVEKEIKRGRKLVCSLCGKNKTARKRPTSATAGCTLSRCQKSFHFLCAKRHACTSRRRTCTKQGAEVDLYRVFCCKEHKSLHVATEQGKREYSCSDTDDEFNVLSSSHFSQKPASSGSEDQHPERGKRKDKKCDNSSDGDGDGDRQVPGSSKGGRLGRESDMEADSVWVSESEREDMEMTRVKRDRGVKRKASPQNPMNCVVVLSSLETSVYNKHSRSASQQHSSKKRTQSPPFSLTQPKEKALLKISSDSDSESGEGHRASRLSAHAGKLSRKTRSQDGKTFLSQNALHGKIGKRFHHPHSQSCSDSSSDFDYSFSPSRPSHKVKKKTPMKGSSRIQRIRPIQLDSSPDLKMASPSSEMSIHTDKSPDMDVEDTDSSLPSPAKFQPSTLDSHTRVKESVNSVLVQSDRSAESSGLEEWASLPPISMRSKGKKLATVNRLKPCQGRKGVMVESVEISSDSGNSLSKRGLGVQVMDGDRAKMPEAMEDAGNGGEAADSGASLCELSDDELSDPSANQEDPAHHATAGEQDTAATQQDSGTLQQDTVTSHLNKDNSEHGGRDKDTGSDSTIVTSSCPSSSRNIGLPPSSAHVRSQSDSSKLDPASSASELGSALNGGQVAVNSDTDASQTQKDEECTAIQPPDPNTSLSKQDQDVSPVHSDPDSNETQTWEGVDEKKASEIESVEEEEKKRGASNHVNVKSEATALEEEDGIVDDEDSDLSTECVLVIPADVRHFEQVAFDVQRSVSAQLGVGEGQLYMWTSITPVLLPASCMLYYFADIISAMEDGDWHRMRLLLTDMATLSAAHDKDYLPKMRHRKTLSPEEKRREVSGLVASIVELLSGANNAHSGMLGMFTCTQGVNYLSLIINHTCDKSRFLRAIFRQRTRMFEWREAQVSFGSFHTLPETIMQASLLQECSILRKWCTSNFSQVSRVLLLPEEDVLLNRNPTISSESYCFNQLKTRMDECCVSSSSEDPDSSLPVVVFIRSLDQDIVRFQPYLQACVRKYCVEFDERPVTCVFHVNNLAFKQLPRLHLEGAQRSVQFYTAFDPAEKPVSLLIVEVKRVLKSGA